MPEGKPELKLDLLKEIIEKSGLSEIDFIIKLARRGAFSSCSGDCDISCTSCQGGCNQGPNKSNSP